MLDFDQWQVLARAFPAIAQLSKPFQLRVREEGRAADVPDEQVLFEDGDECAGVLAVCRGRVRVSKLSADGRELWLYDIHPGEFCVLTVNCLLGEGRYPASGRTVEIVEGAFLPGTLFETLIEADPKFRRGVFRMLGTRLTEVMTLVEEVAFLRLDARLASLLRKQAVSDGPGSDCAVVEATHQQLADDLGCAREVVSRVLESFQRQGWIRLGRKRIEVIDRQQLRRIGDGSVT